MGYTHFMEFFINCVSRGITGILFFAFSGDGMKDVHLGNSSLLKTFYSVICSPSSVSINRMDNVEMRFHHKIRQKNTGSMIIGEDHKRQQSFGY